MLSVVAARSGVALSARRFSTQASRGNFPYKTFADGGHRNQLQVEPKLSKSWLNFKGSPEIIPIFIVCGASVLLATYKTFFVSTGLATAGTLQYPEENVRE